ncbi:MAG: hypothetical protein HY912_19585 [Desulfomonile tiedjei]|uniref:Uncharacterized protein n=1 Tax=Desulfomonile tiedjei TaxID=2358 RepID=A0A9D6Z836_9BACT|nr:hypothetical protein [Desulfomonile tiedjei]
MQWVGGSIVLGFFLGFVDTLMIAAVLGHLGLKLPAYFGVPTTFTGYFFTGMIVGKLAPPEIEWECPIGIVACVVLLMLGLVGMREQGVLLFILHYLLIPGVAVGVCYLGLRVARRKTKAKVEPGREGLAG